MERIREAAAVLSRPKPRQEEVRPLQSKWLVDQKKDKKTRPLREVLDELQAKVIKAAKELQLRSAEQPVVPSLLGVEDPFLPKAARELQLRSAEQPATPSLLGVEEPFLPELEHTNEDPFLAELKRRQLQPLLPKHPRNT